MMSTNFRDIFLDAVKSGELQTLRNIEVKLPILEIQMMIGECNFKAFYLAASNGHLPVLEYLEEKEPKLLQEVIRANDFEAFSWAAGNGYLPVLEYLEAKAPELLQEMIRANDFRAFSWAAGNGYLPVLEYLEAKAPELLQEMIRADDFEAFRFAASNSHLPVLEYLEAKAPELLQEMLATSRFGAFRSAVKNNHLHVSHHLLQYESVLNYATSQENEYKEILDPFLEEKLNELREKQSSFELEMFDISKEEANYYFILWRYLAHSYESTTKDLEQCVFLMKIPTLRHVAANHGNDLLEFVRRLGLASKKLSLILPHLLQYESVLNYAESHRYECNQIIVPFLETKWNELRERRLSFERSYPQGVFDISEEEANYYRILWRHFIRSRTVEAHERCVFLMEIPALRSVAASHDNDLLRLALSLDYESAVCLLLGIESVRVLAESSRMHAHGLDLHALSRQQENSMIALTQEEQARLRRATEEYQPILNRKTVKNIIADFKRELRARYAAAPALISGVALPFTFADFMALGLSGEQKKAALQAYYQHKVHTAYRYLSKPNFWLHEAASYVESNPLTGQRWATFEDYLPFIALLYEAARDTSSPPIDGYTLASRVEALIDELAYIGRAHNWDRTRASRTAAAQEEEYDDLEGDKPSCYSGTKRRLFQAGRGHALFKVLSPDDVKAHIYEAFRAHIIDKLQDSLVHERIKAIWATLLESPLSKEDSEYLAHFNFTSNEVEAFVEKLKRQYRDGFTAELQAMVRQQFILAPNQLVYWGGQINLARLLAVVPEPMIEIETFESQEECSGRLSITPATYAPWLIKVYNSQFFSSWQLRILSLILIMASTLLITSLMMNTNTLALADPVIADMVVKLSPLALNAILGTTIGVAAASTLILGVSLYRTGLFARKNQDMLTERLGTQDAPQFESLDIVKN